MSIGAWAYQSGAGLLGAIFAGLIAAGLTLGFGQIGLMLARTTWARLLIAFVFVAPAVMAGYHATHGVVKHAVPSEAWQHIFSVIGAIAVGCTAFVRVAGMACTQPSPRNLAST